MTQDQKLVVIVIAFLAVLFGGPPLLAYLGSVNPKLGWFQEPRSALLACVAFSVLILIPVSEWWFNRGSKAASRINDRGVH